MRSVAPTPEDVRAAWADRSGEYSPAYYAHRGPDATSDAIRRRCERVVGTDARVLELGCSSGRHLAHLHNGGFRRLEGVEVNPDAVDVMGEVYPALAETAIIHETTMEAALPEFADDAFDAVYSVETLQHVHPDTAWVFDEVARVTDDLLITAEIENEGDGALGVPPEVNAEEEAAGIDPDPAVADAGSGVNHVAEDLPLYYRNWKQVFVPRGFEQVGVETTRRDTVRAFRPTDR
ncbi:class I SAM-dependent methyltransferase [Halorubrum gandharaense]